jgi:hypothetical protein
LKRLENGTRRKERDYRTMVRYASGDRHGLKPFAYHLPLGKILTDGTRRGIVTTFTLVGRGNMPSARIAIGRNGPLVQSQELVQPFAKKREPTHQKGEKPR